MAEQLRVASGHPLSFTQDDVDPRGHAFECRINAEDPAGGRFLPSPGTLTRFSRPGGFGVRIDAGYGEGDAVSQHYDNLIAKVLSWGRDREEARRRMLRVLREMTIEGVTTNVAAHLRILEHPDFIAGTHSTRWVEERLDFSDIPPSPPQAASVSPVLAARAVHVEVEGRRYDVRVWLPEGAAAGPAVGEATGSQPAPGPQRRRTAVGPRGTSGGCRIVAPMQGTIVDVLVAVGDVVELGQVVCVLEAMKMENEVPSECAGQVSEVRVVVGDTVGAGDVLVVVE